MKGFCVFAVFLFFVFLFCNSSKIYAIEKKQSFSQSKTDQVQSEQSVRQANQEEQKVKEETDKGSVARSGGKKAKKEAIKEKSSSEKKKLEEIKETLFPVDEKTLLWIRKKTEETERIKNFEMYPKKGKVRWFYFGKDDVCELKLAVSRVTTVCFWGEVDEKGGVVVGDEELFRVQIIENKRCVSFFPLVKFKESNAVVFVGEVPYAFTLKEVYDIAEMDYVVFVEKKPGVTIDRFLKMIVTGERPKDIFSFVREERSEKGKRYIFEGENRIEVREMGKNESCEGTSYCVDKSCYCAVEK